MAFPVQNWVWCHKNLFSTSCITFPFLKLHLLKAFWHFHDFYAKFIKLYYLLILKNCQIGVVPGWFQHYCKRERLLQQQFSSYEEKGLNNHLPVSAQHWQHASAKSWNQVVSFRNTVCNLIHLPIWWLQTHQYIIPNHIAAYLDPQYPNWWLYSWNSIIDVWVK